MHDVGLRRKPVAHVRDVANVDHGAVDVFDRQIAQLGNHRGRIVKLDRIFEAADLLGSDRRKEILHGKRVGDILAGQAARLHCCRVEVDLNLSRLAAVRIGNCRAWHGDQRNADEIEAEVGELLFG